MTTSTKPLVWLITGCSSGFGTSLAFIALKAGHKVIATSRTPSKTPDLVNQVEDLGGLWLPLDVTGSREHLQKVIDEGTKKFGRIDVLVNNAGIGILGALEDFSQEETNIIMSTNFLGPLHMSQAVIPQMRAQGSGTIVNISSGAGIDASPSMGMYGATKFALEGMSQGFAKELAPFGIRILVIQPGAFTTNMANAMTFTKKYSKEYDGTAVGNFIGMFKDEKYQFKSPNNVEKGCQGIFEAVTLTGRGEGKEGNLRLPLSKDIAKRTLEQVKRFQDGYEAWREIWESTEHDGGELKALPAK